ncbi:alpha-ketoglutarate-dependent dioxygenase AlkB [Streptomyces roseirectus]|uniref:Alpha-ketoglutarate-dependent dioxygenase AlkB n=1 Tax=Streptomyces roseirectus TaxID=2768066 RepID=A0A7H0I7X8_9ACTN|nr:alpha-ketoglutarate-dependent dioxygenase AlkB [Streptomyces roseirectus]QNP68894.1 alpha-ketoglutarate-dependent dioxygenase AlkB [Streptomyces roseirectus]
MDAELFPRERAQVAPGAVHVPDWLDADAQRELLEACRAWARPPAGLRTVRTPGGGTMTARQVCLGWHWYPYGYSRTVSDGDGSAVKPFPAWLGELGRRAVREAYATEAVRGPVPVRPVVCDASLAHSVVRDVPPSPAVVCDTPPAPWPPYDIALVNFYDGDARMGMHQDADERSDAPVVSLSLGDRCVFRFGNTETRGRPYTDVELRSGDLFVFGGASRMAYHAVPRVLPGTAPAGLGLVGRLNVTLRVSGFAHGHGAERIMGDSPS